jgi:hypothetical protein
VPQRQRIVVPCITCELAHPRADVAHDVDWYDAKCALHFLKVFVCHFLVVRPGRVVLGEIIRKIEFTRGPDEVGWLYLILSFIHQ